MSEILAPAGGENSVYAAINAGADAIYLGLDKFSARSSAENFDLEKFEKICKYAHAFGVKVYAALNTVVKQSEVQDFISYAVNVWNVGADALIVQDIFLGGYLKKLYPQITLHLSTQGGTCNLLGARQAKEYGFDRVILARETKLSDIKEIAKIIETEAFVQGALCTCFSGQCYMSSFAGGNSGNRGMCKQPCRKQYSVDRNGFSDKAYRISLADLCVGEKIFEYVSAGVASFKIEGRMRRPEYVAAAVNYYRNLLNGKPCENSLSDLKRTFNRGNFTHGLAFGQDKSFISSAVQGHIGEFVGIIRVENSKYICRTKQKFGRGDGFKILRDGKEVGGGTFGGEIFGGFIVLSRDRLKNGDKVFVTTDTALNARLMSQKRLIKVSVEVNVAAGTLPFAIIGGKKIYGEAAADAAKNRPLTVEDVQNCFKKVDAFPFIPQVSVCTDGAFMPSSALNAFRRKVYSEYYESISASSNKQLKYQTPQINYAVGVNSETAVISTCLNGEKADIGILKLSDYSIKNVKPLLDNFDGEKFLYLPPYLSDEEINGVISTVRTFDGVYCDGYYGLKLAESLGKKFFAGLGFNVTNAISLANCHADYVCLSKELTLAEADLIAAHNTFYLSGGNIKVMDLIYCPFEKKCASCDRRESYVLTDSEGRNFPMRRYRTSECRFEIYNCADLVDVTCKSGKLYDKTLKVENFGKTRGHTVNGIY